MRLKVRGTLQIQEDVKRLFMLAKPLNITSSDFLKGLLAAHARGVREAQRQDKNRAGISFSAGLNHQEGGTKINRVTCIGRPPGAKDLRPRQRRTKKELGRSTARKTGSSN